MTELNEADFLRDLANRLMNVPVRYGVDGGDIDRLAEIAAALRPGEAVPVAWLKEWEMLDGDEPVHRSRVDRDKYCEPWLERIGPRITPLYSTPSATPDYRAGMEAAAKVVQAQRSYSNPKLWDQWEKGADKALANAILAIRALLNQPANDAKGEGQ